MVAFDLGLVDDLTAVLDGRPGRGELALYFQPEVDLSTGGVAAMEALLRWHHPDRGVLPAASFLPAAEAAGLRGALARWALHECAAEAARWHVGAGADLPCVLWANLSSEQLRDPEFPAEVHRLVERHRLPAESLGLEMTEEQIATADPKVLDQLPGLRATGVALAIDDFGSWHSSLETFEDLPIDAVKLDGEFVHQVGGDIDDDTIVASVIRLAHARDLYVVAEGVESWAQGARLLELGCDHAIGYLFGPPERPARARAILRRASSRRGFGLRTAVGDRSGDATSLRTMLW